MKQDVLRKQPNMSRTSAVKKQRILVVGDWMVDEHWVTGPHRSTTSSRTGSAHYRALQDTHSSVESLCGAGRTASVLHGATKSGKLLFDVLGLGIWNSQDHQVLEHMFDSREHRGQNPLSVTRRTNKDVRPGTLLNLASFIRPKAKSNRKIQEFGTIKIIRIYERVLGSLELRQRIDWVLPGPGEEIGHPSWLREIDDATATRITNELNPKTIDAVVVKDLGYGVISNALIKYLVGALPKCPWFVSSKNWDPEWLQLLRPVNLRVLVVPEVAAQTRIQERRFSNWTSNGLPSKEAIDTVDGLVKKMKRPPLVIVVPDRMSTLAFDFENDAIILRTAKSSEIVNKIDEKPVPLASVLLPALVACHLANTCSSTLQMLKHSYAFTRKWMAHEFARVSDHETWQPESEPLFEAIPETNLSENTEWNVVTLQDAKDLWMSASRHMGIIKDSTGKRIELVRAMSEVDGFVCCDTARRETIRHIVSTVAQFIANQTRTDRKSQHVSLMIVSRPGEGKTHLVRQIAEMLKMRFLAFNITQMVSKADIFDCFDTIATTQVQSKNQPLLVFVDEINALLENQLVYNAFLSPLEEGVYIRGSKTFRIAPCAWIFAGTESPLSNSNKGDDKNSKGSDFESRLTIRPPCELKPPAQDEGRTENVYLGVALIHSEFDDVFWVSEKVLKTFHSLPANIGIRELKYFIRSFVNIRYGRVLSTSLPTEWIKKHGVDIEAWQGEDEGDLVQIV